MKTVTSTGLRRYAPERLTSFGRGGLRVSPFRSGRRRREVRRAGRGRLRVGTLGARVGGGVAAARHGVVAVVRLFRVVGLQIVSGGVDVYGFPVVRDGDQGLLRAPQARGALLAEQGKTL